MGTNAHVADATTRKGHTRKAHLSAQVMQRDFIVTKGYYMRGDSLIGQPMRFPSAKGSQAALARACRRACLVNPACHIFTFNVQRAVCYLKAKTRPIGGRHCSGDDCWYHGRVDNPPLMALSIRDATRELGLRVKDVSLGSGALLQQDDQAVIRYVGRLDNDKIFDSGRYVFNFGQGMVIAGDDVGLAGMRVGGERRLTIPAVLAYGWRGYKCTAPCVTIPPGATLHFDIVLDWIGKHQMRKGGYKEAPQPRTSKSN
jgi:hypothetical protein